MDTNSCFCFMCHHFLCHAQWHTSRHWASRSAHKRGTTFRTTWTSPSTQVTSLPCFACTKGGSIREDWGPCSDSTPGIWEKGNTVPDICLPLQQRVMADLFALLSCDMTRPKLRSENQKREKPDFPSSGPRLRLRLRLLLPSHTPRHVFLWEAFSVDPKYIYTYIFMYIYKMNRVNGEYKYVEEQQRTE